MLQPKYQIQHSILNKQFLLQILNLDIISIINYHKERALSGLIELDINLKVGFKWLTWGYDGQNLFQILSDNILALLPGSEGKASLGNDIKV